MVQPMVLHVYVQQPNIYITAELVLQLILETVGECERKNYLYKLTGEGS